VYFSSRQVIDNIEFLDDLPTHVLHEPVWVVVNPRNEVSDLRFLSWVICSCANLGPKKIVRKLSHDAEMFSIRSQEQLLVPSDTVQAMSNDRESLG
jgi:hypothetical protein